MAEFKREERKHVFKKGIDSAEGRRRRDETRIQLRKNKREEGLSKRRAMGAPSATATPGSFVGAALSPTSGNVEIQTTGSVKKNFGVEDIPSLVSNLMNSNASDEVILESIRGFRRMLSIEKNPPVREVLAANALPHFVQLLSRADSELIQFEAAWALTNVASTDYTANIVDVGAVPQLISLLRSTSADVREQSAWCLGNVAGDSSKLRDHVLQAGAMEPLLQNIIQPANDSLLQNAVWALSNFCRGKPHPKLNLVAPAIPHLARLLQSENSNVVMDAGWALSYLSDGDDDRIQAVMDSGVTATCVSLLSHNSSNTITPALRTLGNFVSGTDEQTQQVLDAGVLVRIEALLSHQKRTIRKEACWLLSNIAAGTHAQISILLNLPRLLMTVISAASTAEWEVRKEATWVVSNIATGGNDPQVMALVELGGIDAICSVLSVADPKITMVALDAIAHILEVGQRHGKCFDSLVDEADGLDAIEGLQEHENDEIYQKSVKIIETYFGADDGEDENLAPAINGNTFSFGVSNKMADEAMGQPQQQPLQTYNFA